MEAQTFWRGIWSERKEHHKNAEWLKVVIKELEQDECLDKIDTTKDNMMIVLRKMRNWEARGPHNALGHWLKYLTPLHDRLLVFLKDCLNSGVVPEWLTKEPKVLIQQCLYAYLYYGSYLQVFWQMKSMAI